MAPAGQRFGRDMSDAGAGGDAAEAGVGEQGHVLAGGKPLEGGGDLIDLLHARAGGAAAYQHHDVVLADLAVLDGVDGRLFGDKDAGRTEWRKTLSASMSEGSMEVLLMTEPSGARLPRGNRRWR